MDLPSAIPDRLQYNIKATAVDSTNTMKSTPADGQDFYQGDSTSTMRFVIPHSTFCEFCDPTMSRFRMQIQVFTPNDLIPYDGTIDRKLKGHGNDSQEYVFFDRGIESIIRRVQIFDTSGNLLESIDHYNCLYAVTELCTSEPDVRKSRGRFTMECLDAWNYEIGSCVWPEQFPTILSADRQNQPRVINVAFNLVSGVFGGSCEKYWPMKAINGLVIELQLQNPQECLGYRFVPILAADLAKLARHNVNSDYARQNNWIEGVASDNQQ